MIEMLFGEKFKRSDIQNSLRFLLCAIMTEVAYDSIEEVQVWRDHFERIPLPRHSENFMLLALLKIVARKIIWMNF